MATSTSSLKFTDRTIGIDLGTTFSCVGVFRDGKVEIIKNKRGKNTTPSVVAFTDTGRLFGEDAVEQMEANPENTLFDAKRIIGCDMYDLETKRYIENWPFTVINQNGKPAYKVEYKCKTEYFTPEQISSMVLRELKEDAESFLEEDVKNVVITVPANFNRSQRQATKDAGTAAGFEQIRIINEPTAAALAYGLQEKVLDEIQVLVFDLGGGTFDVSILTIDKTDGFYSEVVATVGDAHIGGQDFNNCLAAHFAKKFQTRFKKDIVSDKAEMLKLHAACEIAKRELSMETEATIAVHLAGIFFKDKIDRPRFLELNKTYFDRIVGVVQEALKLSKFKKSEINEVVLVGGSSRIPEVQRLLQKMFVKKELNVSINPDEAIAHGASVMAGILTQEETCRHVVLQDVTPLSLGLEDADGGMEVIIKAQTKIPIDETGIFTTESDNQTSILFKVYEGERPKCEDNHILGSFRLSGIIPVPCGVPQIEVTFKVDVDGILRVSAMDTVTENKVEAKISEEHGQDRKGMISRMLEEAEKYKEQDEIQRQQQESRRKLKKYTLAIKNILLEKNKMQNHITPEEGKQIGKTIEESLDWMEQNKTADKEELDYKIKEIEDVCGPILTRIYKICQEKVQAENMGLPLKSENSAKNSNSSE